MQFAVAAASAGERVSFFIFEEHRTVFLKRAASLGFDLGPAIDAGHLAVHQIDPAEMSAGEFAYAVRTSVETVGSSMVIIDSLNGYFNAMPEEHFLTLHLHELLSYLVDAAVTTILIVSQHGALGAFGRAISMLKKRTSAHEQTVREFRLSWRGVGVGPVLDEFRGILSGMQAPDTGAGKREPQR